ncbi:hypothetical protein Tco_0838376 [Tanacetum coccineum]|uniref:Uncharacterized protein n=1 Tax=Tanacetum coccineum TaxID=301880 RepID=A0ABQ5AS63_9ASTR
MLLHLQEVVEIHQTPIHPNPESNMLRAFSLFLLALAASEVFGADEDTGSVVAWSPLVIISHMTDEVGGIGTDKAKITRKPSKTGKHGHGKRKSTKEAGKSSQTFGRGSKDGRDSKDLTGLSKDKPEL